MKYTLLLVLCSTLGLYASDESDTETTQTTGIANIREQEKKPWQTLCSSLNQFGDVYFSPTIQQTVNFVTIESCAVANCGLSLYSLIFLSKVFYPESIYPSLAALIVSNCTPCAQFGICLGGLYYLIRYLKSERE